MNNETVGACLRRPQEIPKPLCIDDLVKGERYWTISVEYKPIAVYFNHYWSTSYLFSTKFEAINWLIAQANKNLIDYENE